MTKIITRKCDRCEHQFCVENCGEHTITDMVYNVNKGYDIIGESIPQDFCATCTEDFLLWKKDVK